MHCTLHGHRGEGQLQFPLRHVGHIFCSDVDYATGAYFDFRGLRLSDGRLLDIPPGSWYPVSLAPRNLILTVKSQVGGAAVEWREGGRGLYQIMCGGDKLPQYPPFLAPPDPAEGEQNIHKRREEKQATRRAKSSFEGDQYVGVVEYVSESSSFYLLLVTDTYFISSGRELPCVTQLGFEIAFRSAQGKSMH